MNLPNKLTVLRMLLIPVFLVFMTVPTIPHNYLWAFVIFAVASLTDMLDGKIARARGLVTNFGKFMDPLADKLLVMSALVCLTQVDWGFEVPAVVLVLILAREFAVTALRTIAADCGVVIAADKWGKIKTVSQMVWICYGLLLLEYVSMLNPAVNYQLPAPALVWIYWIGMAIVVIATVGSGINYLWKNKQVFMSSR